LSQNCRLQRVNRYLLSVPAYARKSVEMRDGIAPSISSPSRFVEAAIQCIVSGVSPDPDTRCAVDILAPVSGCAAGCAPGALHRIESPVTSTHPTLDLFFSTHYLPDPSRNHRLDRVLRTEEPLLVSRLSETEPETCSYLCVPLVNPQGGVLGAFTMVSESRELTDAQLPGVMRAALAIASLLQLSGEHERMSQEICAIRDWISILAHELKTPLTPLSMQAGLVRRLTGQLEQPELRLVALNRLLSVAEITDKQVHRIDSLVNSLLEMARIDAGQMSLKEQHTSLKRIAAEVIQQFTRDLGLPRDLIVLEADGEGWGYWDGLKIEQVINNLVSNAIKYGEGKPVQVRLHETTGRILLEVIDRGPGVAPANRERIFRRFERLHPRGGVPGLGLGLYISREIIRRHGGDIRVTSEPGQGSTFVVELPRVSS